MIHQSFSIRHALSQGFKRIYEHIGFLFGLLLIQIGIYVVVGLIYQFIFSTLAPYLQDESMSFIYQNALDIPLNVSLMLIGLRCVVFLIETIVFITTVRIFLDIYDRGSSSYKDFFVINRFIIPYIVASICFGIFGALGLIALVVPGLIVITMLNFYDIIIVDQNCGPIEALKISQKMTRGLRLKLFLFIAIGAILSAITFGILYPVILMARIDVYKKLKSAHSWM